VAQRLAEQKAALVVVNGTLSNVQVEQAKAAAIATSELRTALAAVNISTASALTALAARADGIEVAAASLKTATTAQISSVEQQLGQVEGRTNISLSMQWTKSLEALEAVRSQAQRNISAVETALTASLAGAEERWNAQLDKADSATRTAVEKLRGDTSASIAKGAAELSVAVAAVNASLGKEMQHREAADGALGHRLDGLASDLASYSNKTDQQLRQHAAELQLQSQALAIQQTALASTIKNFTTQQVERAAALTQQVEARVKEAEVQQQLGAVAVAALRNETNRLHMSVDGAMQRLQANEIGTVTLRAGVAHLTTQQAALQDVQNNITTVVLPPVFSRLGALERAVEDSNGEAVRGRTELVAKIEAFGQRTQQVESAVGSVEQSLQRLQRDLETNNGATMVAITKLQEQQNAAAAQANMTSAAVHSLTSAAELSAVQALTTKEHSLELAEAKRRLDAQQQQIDSLVTAVQAARAASESSVAALRETVDAQAVRIRSLEETVQRQRSELNEAKEDNHRLLREGASNASVDELRKLLFELQGQMLGHSSKVLDLLLQPRSAVVVKDPCGTTVAEPSVSEKLETTVNPDVSA
jgi:chromosome segregation ATPase